MHLDTITELLNIPNHKVAGVIKSDPERRYMILERIKDTPPVCSGCGHVHGTSVHSREIVLVEDLRMSGKRIFLWVPKRKIRCIEDGRIRVEEINWIKGRFTDRFARPALKVLSRP